MVLACNLMEDLLIQVDQELSNDSPNPLLTKLSDAIVSSTNSTV